MTVSSYRATTSVVLFLVYSLIVLSPDILLVWQQDPVQITAARVAHVLLLSLSLYVALCALVGRLYILAWVLLPVALLAPGELYYMATYHQPSSSHVLAVILDTNPDEAGDYLRGRLWQFAGLLLLNVGLCTVLCVELTRRRLHWRSGGNNLRWVVLLLSAVFLVVLYSNRDQNLKGPVNEVNFWNKNAEFLPSGFNLALRQNSFDYSFPFGLPMRVQDFLAFRRQQLVGEQYLASFRFHAHQYGSVPGKQVYVMVIGESSRRDRWQLNGYGRPTNPRLVREANLVNFSNVISLAAYTVISVPFMVTQHQPQEVGLNEKSVVTAFKEAGFTTYWLSNQDPQGAIGAMFATEADHKAFFNPSDWRHQGTYDEVLLKPLQDILAKPESRQFIVLHTMGSHFDYAGRYPDAFDVFKPSAKPAGSLSMSDASNAPQLNNSYDNSVLYTDYFISEVVRRLKDSGSLAFMLYSSDHGEDLLGGDCPNFGHGFMDRKNLEIPSMAWYSDSYAARFPDRVANLRAHANLPLTEQVYTPTLLDAASIQVDNPDLGRSLVSPRLSYHPRVVLTSPWALDYDRARLSGYCESVVAGDSR